MHRQIHTYIFEIDKGTFQHFPVVLATAYLPDAEHGMVGVILLVHLQRFAGCIEGLVHSKQAAVGSIETYHVGYQELRCLQFQLEKIHKCKQRNN
jgi:hypothetical protein